MDDMSLKAKHLVQRAASAAMEARPSNQSLLTPKQFAQRAARAAGRSPEGATIKLPEAETYWIGLPLSQCVFHRDVGDWTITVSPGAERKTVVSLLQGPVETSKCTQTDVLFFLLGLKNSDTQTSVFDITTEELFRRMLSVSPHAQCSVSGAGQRKYLIGRLDRLLPGDGGALTPQLVQIFYDEHDLGPEERKMFPSHSFSRDRRQGEQDAGGIIWRNVHDGIERLLPSLKGIKKKDLTEAQFQHALDEDNQRAAKRAPSRPSQNKRTERNVGTQKGDWTLRWQLHQPTASENDWALHIQIHSVADSANKVPLLQFARVKASESRLRQHAAQLAAIVPVLASHCVARRGAEVSFCKDRVVLDCAAAERFICEWSTRLREIGHEIVISATLDVEYRKRVIVIRRRPIDFNSSSGLFTAEKLLKFRWDVVLNGEPIDVAELESLAEQKRALLQWRGKWIFFEPEKYSPEKLAKIAEHIRQQPVESLSRFESLRAVFEKDSEWNGIPLETDDGEVSGADWLGKLCGRSPLVDIGKPDGLKPEVKLRHYQQSGLNWLSFMSANGFGALLADDMGLGKTLQTLAWLQHRRNSGSQKPCLLVCPTSVMDNWKVEAEKFAPTLRLSRHHGLKRAKTGVEVFTNSQGRDLVITTYGALKNDVEILMKVAWDAVILNESQNIKTPETAVSKAARAVGKDAAFRLALTGTPIENGVVDLWTQFDFLNPGLLGSQTEFERRFSSLLSATRATSPGDQRTRDEDAKALKRLTSPFIKRRLKTDPTIAPELPPKIETDEWCHLTEEQAELYRATLKNLEAELASATGIKRSAAVLRVLTKLKQTCNHPAHVLKDRSQLDERSGKLNRLVEMLEDVELKNGFKALIFTQFAEMGRMLEIFLIERLGVGTQFLCGEDSEGKRQEKVKTFQEDSRYPIFILTYKAGGVGLNLQAGNYVFLFDRWWNPAVEDQAIDRAYRIGQAKDVFVYKFICKGTVEERIDELIRSKRELAESIISDTARDSLGKHLADMSNDELRTFFSLRVDAVSED